MRGLFPIAAFTTVLAACVLAGLSVAYTWTGQATGTFQAQAGVWGPIPATVDIDPDTLNPGSEGNYVMAYIELSGGFDVGNIDVSTVRLCLGHVAACPEDASVTAAPSPTAVGDHDGDGIPDRMVKFDRAEVLALLGGVGEHATVVVAGELSSGERFEGSDLVRLLDPPTATPAPVQMATPAPTAATPTPSPIPVPTAAATPVPTASPTPVATASPTPVPTASPTPVATASATPVPIASPTPSATPVPAPGGIYVSVTCQGQPVAGAQVRVSHQSPGEPVVWSGGTGDDGELSTGLVLNAGTYLVDIVKQGASYDSVIATVPAGAYAPVYAQCTAEWGTGYRD